MVCHVLPSPNLVWFHERKRWRIVDDSLGLPNAVDVIAPVRIIAAEAEPGGMAWPGGLCPWGTGAMGMWEVLLLYNIYIYIVINNNNINNNINKSINNNINNIIDNNDINNNINNNMNNINNINNINNNIYFF